MENRDTPIFALLEQLQALSPKEDGTCARLSLRNATGDFLGEALLSDKAVDALTVWTTSLNSCLRAEPTEPEPAEPEIDPLLAADFEEHCIALPVDDLFDLAKKDQQKAVAEFDEMTTYLKKGEE